MTPLVKICGLGSPGDAAAAAAAGADFAGVVLAPGRLRSRPVEAAAVILAAAGPARRVGVFADASPEAILAAAAALRLDVVQLHGAEPPEVLAELRRGGAPWLWKALRAEPGPGLAARLEAYGAYADAILLDGGDGGRGVPFEWAAFGAVRAALPAAVRLVVAGGLTAENVGQAVAALRPDVVDVSSGVEASPGCKSERLVRAFVAAARRSEGRE